MSKVRFIPSFTYFPVGSEELEECDPIIEVQLNYTFNEKSEFRDYRTGPPEPSVAKFVSATVIDPDHLEEYLATQASEYGMDDG